jgi:hypothetical protein
MIVLKRIVTILKPLLSKFIASQTTGMVIVGKVCFNKDTTLLWHTTLSLILHSCLQNAKSAVRVRKITPCWFATTATRGITHTDFVLWWSIYLAMTGHALDVLTENVLSPVLKILFYRWRRTETEFHHYCTCLSRILLNFASATRKLLL